MVFLLLVFALTVPFLLLGAVTRIQLLPALPVASLMAVCPATAALILVYRDDGAAGALALLKRGFDYRRIRGKLWYVPILFLMPGIMTLSLGVLRRTGTPVPAPRVALIPALLLCALFFIGALLEELGWSGYLIDPIQNRWGALPASIIVGLVWAVFHYVALLEADRSWDWIAWWSLWTIALRVIIVWLYDSTGKSVFAAVLFHTTINVTWQMFPIRGSFFDPRVTGLITAIVAVAVVIIWGPRSLERCRFSS